MPMTRMAIVGLALATATATATAPAACKHHDTTAPTSATTTPKARVQHDDPEVEFDASCDQNNHAVNVKPNTKKAKAAAEKMCQNTGKAIDEAPWPSGLHPIPLPTH